MKISIPLLILTFSWSFANAQNEKLVVNEQIDAYQNTSYLIMEKLTIKPPIGGGSFSVSAATDGDFHARMYDRKTNYNGSQNKNFIRTEAIQVTGLTDEYELGRAAIDSKLTSFQYMDGLARDEQIVNVQITASLNDLVQPMAYDQYGRESLQYLPYKATTSNGTFRASGTSEAVSYYSSLKGDARPFIELDYELSPLNRVKAQFGPGDAWKNDDKKRQSLVIVNAANEIKKWTISGNIISHSNYAANTLLGVKSIDEDDREVVEFENARNQLVVKRVKSGTSSWFDTYYVYDEIGNLRFVLPPEAVGRLASEYDNATTASKEAFLNEWAFQYKYDNQQRLIEKRLPGWSDWYYLVYDKWDRLVLTKDPTQGNQWEYRKYDAFNRVIMTGFHTQSGDQQTLATAVMASTNRYENENSSAEGYTRNRTFPTSATTGNLLTINYYDNYNFKDNTNWDVGSKNFNFRSISGFASSSFNTVKGYSTGGKIKIVDGTTWLNFTNYYDTEYRLIQTVVENQLGGLDVISNDYDFVGRVVKTQRDHTAGASSVTIVERFEYDHAGRLLRNYHKVDAENEVLIAENSYNELGELIETNHHSPSGNEIQSTDFDYNIRGWLTAINDDNLGGSDGDLFGMNLNYHQTQTIGTPTVARYNGNINSISWKTDNLEESSDQQIYGFTYDWTDRFEKAKYATKSGGTWSGNVGAFDEEVLVYDKNGNIKELDRWGEGSKIDDLTYTYNYNGNQLRNVKDDALNDLGFDDLYDSDVNVPEYTYDELGNMIEDMNKGIDVDYNHLNLPTQVDFSAGRTIDFTYDASGMKLNMAVMQGGSTKETDYISGIVYSDNQLDFIQMPQGRVVNRDGDWDYEYFLKDHLGNTRVTYGVTNEVNTILATIETERQTEEDAEFLAMSSKSSLENHTAASLEIQNPSRSLVLRYGQMGAGKYYDVAAGDKVKLKAHATYEASGGDPSVILDNIAGIVSGSFSVIGGTEGGLIQSNLNTDVNGIATGVNSSSTVPKAYLIYIFYNDNFSGPLVFGYQTVLLNAATSWQKLETEYTAPSNGHLMAYVVNQSDVNVFFDDMEYTHIKNNDVLQVTQTQDYYPFGLTFNEYNLYAENTNEWKFQEQENIDDLGLNWDSFKWRNHQPDLGRFFNVDPLAEDYLHNSTYAFSENKLISYRELEGLEAVLSIAGTGGLGGRDDATFRHRANRHASTTGGTPVSANNGKEFVSVLQRATSTEGSIQSVTVFSHGGPDAIYLEHTNSFYSETDGFKGSNAADIQDLNNAILDGSVKFESGATIVIGGCNCGNVLGPQLTKETGVTTISSTSNVSPEVINGRETGNLISDKSFIKTEFVKTISVVPVPGKIGIDGTKAATTKIEEVDYELRTTDLGNKINPSQY